jgi:hypothetical protein
LYVSVYSPLGLAGATLDGEPIPMTVGEELDWSVYSSFIDLPSHATVVLEITFAGTVEDPDRVVTWVQPMSAGFEVTE